jgi:hypothetical protein
MRWLKSLFCFETTFWGVAHFAFLGACKISDALFLEREIMHFWQQK